MPQQSKAKRTIAARMFVEGLVLSLDYYEKNDFDMMEVKNEARLVETTAEKKAVLEFAKWVFKNLPRKNGAIKRPYINAKVA